MNERIKEFLLKVVPMEGEDGDILPSLHTQKDIEMFAELIVRECADICTARKLTPAAFVASELREYFGVSGD